MATANSKAPVSPENLSYIENELLRVGSIAHAMHGLAVSYENGVSGDTLSVVVECMTKEVVRTLDACIVKMGSCPMGFFSDDLEDAPVGEQ